MVRRLERSEVKNKMVNRLERYEHELYHLFSINYWHVKYWSNEKMEASFEKIIWRLNYVLEASFEKNNREVLILYMRPIFKVRVHTYFNQLKFEYLKKYWKKSVN